MGLKITTNAIKGLRAMKNPSFVIIELMNNHVVDFAESQEEAHSKCITADSHGSKCKFYETSMRTIDLIRKHTKNVDVEHDKKGVLIEGLDTRLFQEEMD